MKTKIKKNTAAFESSEAAEQEKLFNWVEVHQNLEQYPGLCLLYHIPNEGKRSRYTGGKLKLQGLKKGTSDVCLPVARGKYHGLYFEMKYGNNKLTKEQKDFLRGVKIQGYATWVCYSAEEAIELIKAYYHLQREV